MKITLTTLLLITLFLVGCADTPVSPVKNENHSYQLIKLPKKSDLAIENSYSITETINGEVGGTIWLNESYVAVDGHTVYIDVKLKIPKNSFTGNVDFTITADDEYAAVEFSPAMTFNVPLELDLAFIGLDLVGLNLTTGDYDFVFIDDEGNIEVIGYNAIHVNEEQGKLWVTKADIPHFSRYGFIN
ncbi:hypothetical protein ACFLQ4_00500 [Bacteroidota bacterium]